MILHGEMVIELTDENSGTVETIRESNMVTDAVNHLLGLNPLGIFYKASGQYDDMVLWNDYLIPICPNMIKADDTVVALAGASRFPYIGTPMFQYKEFLTGFGGNYGTDCHTTWLLMPYLATINNLSQAIVKNADKTMKITYTLTEQEPSPTP